jgi:hypothetical protein
MGVDTVEHATGTTNVSATQKIWLQGFQQTTNKSIRINSVYFTQDTGSWIANIKASSASGEGIPTDYTVYFYNT